jgi:hypothetical protein
MKYNYNLFTETEGNSVFCGPETAVGGATKHTGCPFIKARSEHDVLWTGT